MDPVKDGEVADSANLSLLAEDRLVEEMVAIASTDKPIRRGAPSQLPTRGSISTHAMNQARVRRDGRWFLALNV